MEAMRQKNPQWPGNIKEKSKALKTAEYRARFEEWGFDYHIIDDDRGRWIILKKP